MKPSDIVSSTIFSALRRSTTFWHSCALIDVASGEKRSISTLNSAISAEDIPEFRHGETVHRTGEVHGGVAHAVSQCNLRLDLAGILWEN
jgi:hypothetical protein